MRIQTLLIITLVAFMLGSCGGGHVATFQLFVYGSIEGEDNQTNVSVYLNTHRGKSSTQWISLLEGERLVAEIDGEQIELKETIDNDRITYDGFFDHNREGAIVKVSFLRPMYEDVIVSFDIPEPIHITAPTEGEFFNGDDSIAFSWDGPQDRIDVELNAECDHANEYNQRSFSSRYIAQAAQQILSSATPVSQIFSPTFRSAEPIEIPVPGSTCVTQIKLTYDVSVSPDSNSRGLLFNTKQVARTSVTVQY